MTDWLIYVVGAVVVGLTALRVLPSALARRRSARLSRAAAEFRLRREALEAKFFQLASSSGKPRGVTWSDVDFASDVTFARNRRTGQLAAFVAVAVRFEPLSEEAEDDRELIVYPRAATAFFYFTRHGWQTDGRAVFNLNPVEAIQHFQAEFERVPMQTTPQPRA